jgi:hypothetical protein
MNPVVTYHGVKIYLVESEWPNCKELVVVAAVRNGPQQIFPGIVLDATDQEALADLFAAGRATALEEVAAFRTESFDAWKRNVVRQACEDEGISLTALTDGRRTRLQAVARVRAKVVRILVGFMSYGEAGRAVGISDHSSVYYWVKGKGKDMYK